MKRLRAALNDGQQHTPSNLYMASSCQEVQVERGRGVSSKDSLSEKGS